MNKHILDKLYTYFIQRLGMFEYTRGWLKGTCPSCSKDLKYGVNLSMYRTNCFSCGYHERPMYVVATVEGIPIQEVPQFLKAFEGLEYIEPKVDGYDFVPVQLPKGFKLLSDGDSELAKGVRNYIKNKRGLDPKVLARKGFGYCTEGKLFGYIIMPFYLKGKLVYYQTRRYVGTGPKFDNPTVEEFGVGKNTLIYNQDALFMYDHVYLVESVFNAETIGDNGVAFGGKSLSNYQISIIIKSPCKRVTILLDPDAYDKALQLGMHLIPYKQVRVVLLPEGEDVNSYGRNKTLIKTYKTRYTTYNGLLKLKHASQRSLHTYH